MRSWSICRGLICSALLAGAAHAYTPEATVRVPQLSDNFEDPLWSFNHGANLSSNGKWYGSFRGAPATLQRVTPPTGGPVSSGGGLSIRSYGKNDGSNNQDDFVTQFYSSLWGGRSPVRADRPLVKAHLYIPPIDPAGPDWSTLGFRIEARSNSLTYYPSLWVNQYNNYVAGGQTYNQYGLSVRMGDGFAADQSVLGFTSTGWHTLGIAFDQAGTGHYYFRQGIGDLTEAHQVYSSTQFPGGSDAKMTSLAYSFLSVGFPAGTTRNSPAYVVDNYDVMIVPEPTAAAVVLFGSAIWLARRPRRGLRR